MSREWTIDAHRPTSDVLLHLLDGTQNNDDVTLTSLLERLRERSFGCVLLLLGLSALVPALSTVVGVLLVWPAMQMIRARQVPAMPAWMSQRQLSTLWLSRFIACLVPVLRRLETVVQPRWRTPLQATKRVVGAITLLLALTLLGPVPFSQVLPALVIMLVAFAYLENDGLMLAIALAAAIISLAITAATLWAAVAGLDLLRPDEP